MDTESIGDCLKGIMAKSSKTDLEVKILINTSKPHFLNGINALNDLKTIARKSPHDLSNIIIVLENCVNYCLRLVAEVNNNSDTIAKLEQENNLLRIKNSQLELKKKSEDDTRNF